MGKSNLNQPSERLAVLAAFIALLSADVGLAALYHLTDLGVLPAGGTATYALSVNGHGAVVGYAYPGQSSSGSDAFVYQNGVLTDLGQPYGGNSIGVDINDAGQVLGWGGAGSLNAHAFIYDHGTYTDLRPLGMTKPGNINALGHISGTGNNHALLFVNGMVQDLGTLGGTRSEAGGINNGDEVVGTSTLANGATHIFRYSNGVMSDLGIPPVAELQYFGVGPINDSGTILGYANSLQGAVTPAGHDHGWVYRNGIIQDLGPDTGAFGINSAGDIVGYTGPIRLENHRARLWQAGGGESIPLDSSGAGWTLYEATDINDSGQITGYGRSPSSTFTHSFLLTPIPEPGGFALIASGAVLALRRRRERATAE